VTSNTIKVNVRYKVTLRPGASTTTFVFSWRWSRGQWYMRARGNATIYNLTAYSPLSKVTAR
jgi:hypothetical protein